MDVPLKFEGSDLTPDLYIRFKYPFFYSSGYIPNCKTVLNIFNIQDPLILTFRWVYCLIQKTYHSLTHADI